MKLIHLIWNIIKNLLWTLFIVIIYFLLIGTIKTGGFENYFFYQNSRDWRDISAQISILEPASLSNIFYSDSDIYEILKDYVKWNQDNLTGNLVDSGSVDQTNEDLVNVYDPEFEEEFNEGFDNVYTGEDLTGADYGFNDNVSN
ncbi:hypothetical protein K9M48_05170 [Candidatus Gracilibacteria bacterium]|nr:hypothetical protein [Candidatus Gracilibacteria bacterium]